ncbi:hypothetical protein J6590_031529 [Homalodisca vitripennis]|nr:hypothetical protein J6590_031529 [Homalodisca vitripennis]
MGFSQLQMDRQGIECKYLCGRTTGHIKERVRWDNEHRSVHGKERHKNRSSIVEVGISDYTGTRNTIPLLAEGLREETSTESWDSGTVRISELREKRRRNTVQIRLSDSTTVYCTLNTILVAHDVVHPLSTFDTSRRFTLECSSL